jgi:putative tricarboxylic transport membrane protein
MIDLFLNSIQEGLKMCGDPLLMLLILVGVLWGTFAGAITIGPNLAVGVALPFCFGLPPTYAIGFLCSINVAVSYGNSIPAILIGVPGTSSAMLTSIDGYALHKQGKTGLALGVQYYGALFGQMVSNFYYLFMVVPLAQLTYVFLGPEMFALYSLGIVSIVAITGDNLVKGLVACAFGFSLALVGRDPVSGMLRYDFYPELRGGLEITPTIMGLLVAAELFRQFRQNFQWAEMATKFEAKFPPLKALTRVTPHVIIGSLIGTFVGAIPGLGGTQAAFMSYNQAKLWSKHPEEFGNGSIEGVAANESAQNASQAGEMVPTFGLGIPGSSTMVFLFAAMLMNGFIPGPMLIEQAPQLLYASWGPGLFAPTIFLLLIGWPICRVLLKVVTIDRTLVLVGALGLCMIGVFSLNTSIFDVFLMVLFGAVGYFMTRYGYPVAAASISLVLGRGFEAYFRRGLLLVDKSLWNFVSRPYTAAILFVSLVLLIYGTWGTIKLLRRSAAMRQRFLEERFGGTSKGAKQ